MATGDMTISIAVEGGVTKSVVLDSATRQLLRADYTAKDIGIDSDADLQVEEINHIGRDLLNRANAYGKANVSYTAKSFTAAT
jgi:hypothetical protein